MSRLITLQDWAKEEFGDLAPSERVLKKYAQGKMMAPPAIKVGRYWMIDRNSRFVGTLAEPGNDSNLLIVFYVQIMPDDFVMQLHRF